MSDVNQNLAAEIIPFAPYITGVGKDISHRAVTALCAGNLGDKQVKRQLMADPGGVVESIATHFDETASSIRSGLMTHYLWAIASNQEPNLGRTLARVDALSTQTSDVFAARQTMFSILVTTARINPRLNDEDLATELREHRRLRWRFIYRMRKTPDPVIEGQKPEWGIPVGLRFHMAVESAVIHSAVMSYTRIGRTSFAIDQLVEQAVLLKAALLDKTPLVFRDEAVYLAELAAQKYAEQTRYHVPTDMKPGMSHSGQPGSTTESQARGKGLKGRGRTH
jgi:hypothetical protein